MIHPKIRKRWTAGWKRLSLWAIKRAGVDSPGVTIISRASKGVMNLAWRVQQQTVLPWSLTGAWGVREMNIHSLKRRSPTGNASSSRLMQQNPPPIPSRGTEQQKQPCCLYTGLVLTAQESPAGTNSWAENGHTSAFRFGVVWRLLQPCLVVPLRVKYPIQKCYEGLIVIMHSKLEPDVHYNRSLSGTKCEKPKTAA